MDSSKDKKKHEEILEETYENYKDIENLMFFVDKYLYYEEVILGKSSNTIRSYRRDILQFMEYIDEYEEIRTFEDVEMLTIRSFIAYLNSDERLKKKKNAKVVSKRSINRKISALRTFFKYLQEKKVIQTNKVMYVNMPKFEKELPNVLSKDDLNKMRSVINTEKITGIRDRLIIELLYSSGIRASELINLNEYVIDFNEREMRIVGKGDKERITFFSRNAKKWLEKYIEEKQFAPGSMLPKVQSCMEFVQNNTHGGQALITSLQKAALALKGETGTIITK